MIMILMILVFPARRAFALSCGSTVTVASRQNDVIHRGESVSAIYVWGHNNPDNSPNGATHVGCARVSTLDVYFADNKQMEIGWNIIPDNTGVCAIDTSAPQQPYFTIIRTSPGLVQTCEWDGLAPLQLDPSVTDSMKANDPNKDG